LALIYGANASGKTTILKALDFLRKICTEPFDKKTEKFDFEPFLFDEADMRVELLSQICSFSQLYWKSVSSQSLPVTVKYPEMLAQIVPNFGNAEIPGAGRERLWFL
jgi:recombinational DNA repair ATPase RecF